MQNYRTVTQIIEPQLVIEGAGVLLRRSFGPNRANAFDPFLLFDHFAFNNPLEGPIKGFPTHPHRGIETVTYMLEGSVNHRDSLGNAGKIGAGDVQWMTSGRGILHEEMPRRGPSGNIFGFQLWVNLPARLKMTAPAYQEHGAERMPVEEREAGVRVKVIAGQTSLGTRGPISAEATQPIYFDIELPQGAEFTEPVAADRAVFVVVHAGQVDVAGQVIEAVGLSQLGAGDTVRLRAVGGPARALLIAGKPLNEAVAWYGPFVMNTHAEIVQAIEDYQAGRF